MARLLQSEQAGRYRVGLVSRGFSDVREWGSRGIDVVPIGADRVQAMLFEPPDGLIVDLDGVDDEDALNRCWRLRDTLGTPLFVVARRMDSFKVLELLHRGAADVIVESPSSGVVAARVSAFLRRFAVPGHTDLTPSLRFCGLELDLDTHRVRSAAGNKALSRNEFNLLVALLHADGRTCTHAELNMLVWRTSRRGPTGNMRLAVSRLRKKLGDDPLRPHIVLNTRGVGYRIATAVNAADYESVGRVP